MIGRSGVNPHLNQQNHGRSRGKCKSLSSLCKQHEGALEQNLCDQLLSSQQRTIVVLLMWVTKYEMCMNQMLAQSNRKQGAYVEVMCWTVKSRAVHRQQTVSEYRLTIVHYSVGRSDLKQYAGYCCGLNDMSMCGCVDCSRRHCNSRCALILPLWVYSSWGVFKCCSFVSFPNPYSCLLSTQDVSPYWPFDVFVVMPRPWHCQCIYY